MNEIIISFYQRITEKQYRNFNIFKRKKKLFKVCMKIIVMKRSHQPLNGLHEIHTEM